MQKLRTVSLRASNSVGHGLLSATQSFADGFLGDALLDEETGRLKPPILHPRRSCRSSGGSGSGGGSACLGPVPTLPAADSSACGHASGGRSGGNGAAGSGACEQRVAVWCWWHRHVWAVACVVLMIVWLAVDVSDATADGLVQGVRDNFVIDALKPDARAALACQQRRARVQQRVLLLPVHLRQVQHWARRAGAPRAGWWRLGLHPNPNASRAARAAPARRQCAQTLPLHHPAVLTHVRAHQTPAMRYRARRASSSAVPRPHARRLLVLLLAGAAAAAAAARSVQPRDDSGLSAALAGEIAAAVGGELHALTQQYLTAVSPSNSWSQYFNISRELLGVGFHRRLELRVAPAPPPAELLSLHGCQAWLVQQLPPGVFADPYELEGLSRSSGLKFQLFGPRDLELPAPACKPTALLLGFQFAAAGQEEEQLQAHATVSVPLHAKYPEPRSWGFSGWQALATGSVDVQLPWPWLLVDCLASEGGVVVLRPPADPLADEQQCSAASAPQHGQCGGSGSLVWSVPAGSLDHERLVSWGSLLAAAACFLVVARKAVATARRRAQQPA